MAVVITFARHVCQVCGEDIGQSFNRSRNRPKGVSGRSRYRCSEARGRSRSRLRGGGGAGPRWRSVVRVSGWPRVAAGRGNFDVLEAGGAGVRPAKPLLRFAVDLVRRCAVVTLVTVVEDAAVYPRHITPDLHPQRLPQFVVKQHAAIATAAVHPSDLRYGVTVRHGVRCGQVIDPPLGVNARAWSITCGRLVSRASCPCAASNQLTIFTTGRACAGGCKSLPRYTGSSTPTSTLSRTLHTYPLPIEIYRGKPAPYGCGDVTGDYGGIPLARNISRRPPGRLTFIAFLLTPHEAK
jgi:hypothetical protein